MDKYLTRFNVRKIFGLYTTVRATNVEAGRLLTVAYSVEIVRVECRLVGNPLTVTGEYNLIQGHNVLRFDQLLQEVIQKPSQ